MSQLVRPYDSPTITFLQNLLLEIIILIPLILCGGSGTRLWPMSRGGYPKQYLALSGSQTLVQQTALRLQGIDGVTAPLLITNHEQRFLLAEQLREINVKPRSIILEPVGRNTAPAVAVASILAQREDPNALIFVLPSDHVILEDKNFRSLAQQAAQTALNDRLVTFGITPTSAHTGYGYIKRGSPLAHGENCFEVEEFVEKPSAAKANEFLSGGEHYWNSGMFMFKASVFLQELARLQPLMLEQAQRAVDKSVCDLDFLRLDEAAFEGCPANSIDYAVMEHTPYAAVIAAPDLGWSDIGSWSALADIAVADEQGNTLIGDVIAEQTSNSYIRAEHRMVATIGITDVIVVETADAVLVAHKNCSQDVKKIVERLNLSSRTESMTHRKVFRPWGSYEGIDQGARFQVKRIEVKPGASLSLQMHHHRAEHWIVVKGTAKIINGDKETLLTENQSTYIPLGALHRLENPGKIMLELIEVQSGTYLGEDDIVRFEDAYGRN